MEIVVIVVVAVVVAARALVRTVVVYDGHRGALYRRGVLHRVLEPGLHRVLRSHRQVRVVDTRPQYATVVGQELLTADGVTVRISLAAVFSVDDVGIAVRAVQDYQAAAYLTLQLALREVVTGRAVDDVLAGRGELGSQLVELARGPFAAMGLALQSADIKDVMFPGELKRVFARVAEARQEGLAALERARGETAALRNLANAAKAVDDHPSLLQLRLIQAIEGSTGHTIVLGRPNGP